MFTTENKAVAALRARLSALGEPKFGEFNCRLIPTVERERVIGVRTPVLRKMASELSGTELEEIFLHDLPHAYFEENNLHAFLVARIRDFSRAIEETERFLPYIDNWATCDQFSPVCFRKNKRELLERIKTWLASEHVYTVRFAIGMLMRYYLEDDFDPAYPAWVAAVGSDEYYVHMMVAWYFATALAFRYEDVLPYLSEHRLPIRTHNKTISKAIESYRISDEKKRNLKNMRRETKE